MGPVLVAVDLADAGEEVVSVGVQLAKGLSSSVYLVHVVPPDPEFVGSEVGPQSVRDYVAQHFREEHRTIQELEARLREDGVEVTTRMLQGPTAEKIREEAVKIGAHMIVMGKHNRLGVVDFLVGSTCRQLLKDPPCPVTLVPS